MTNKVKSICVLVDLELMTESFTVHMHNLVSCVCIENTLMPQELEEFILIVIIS